jgi:hypothetical protein
MPKQHVLVAQGVDAQPLADGVPDDDDDDVLSEEEAEQHALMQPHTAGASPCLEQSRSCRLWHQTQPLSTRVLTFMAGTLFIGREQAGLLP